MRSRTARNRSRGVQFRTLLLSLSALTIPALAGEQKPAIGTIKDGVLVITNSDLENLSGSVSVVGTLNTGYDPADTSWIEAIEALVDADQTRALRERSIIAQTEPRAASAEARSRHRDLWWIGALPQSCRLPVTCPSPPTNAATVEQDPLLRNPLRSPQELLQSPGSPRR